jgi:N-formylglutamate deformylase
MTGPAWELHEDRSPLVATALHHGHDLRDEVAALIALDDHQRLLEEDPHTGGWTEVARTRFVVHRSRFEMDLNRSREHAVYRKPDDAWGLDVWRQPPPADLVERTLSAYDAFYAELHRVLAAAEAAFGRFVVYDVHTYNQHRVDDPAKNPEVNVGTGSLDRRRWGRVVDRFIDDLRAHDFAGRHLDVRENIRFRGGHLARWVHGTFPDSGCALAIEVKKFFMDENTGELHPAVWRAVRDALAATVPGVLEELER